MKVVSVRKAHEIAHFDSQGATIAGVVRASGQVQVSVIELAPGGVLGSHRAVSPQLFFVVRGSGWVRGGDGRRRQIRESQAALWETDEVHESGSDEGLRAVVVEAHALELVA